MASIFFSLFHLLCFFSAALSHHNNPSSPPEILRSCNATRFPDQCRSSLTQSHTLPSNPSPLQIIKSAIEVSSEALKTAQSMLTHILNSSTNNLNHTTIATNCLQALHFSSYRISLTVDALPLGRTKDARAYLSAALQYQSGCRSALKYFNDTQMIDEAMSFLGSLVSLSSNALSMVKAYDNFGNETTSWGPPETERDGFWEKANVSGGFSGGIPLNLTADVTVCKDGSDGCYQTVQEAVNAAPDAVNAAAREFVIYIKEGVYEEIVRVPLEKKKVVFLGDGMGKTVITGSLNAGKSGLSTYNTATVAVDGDGFMADGITIQNTAGSDAGQAVAFRSSSDLSVIQSCEFIGNQDTLYAHSLRQFYKSCRIEGNIDFIFGNSASVFHDCEILIRPQFSIFEDDIQLYSSIQNIWM